MSHTLYPNCQSYLNGKSTLGCSLNARYYQVEIPGNVKGHPLRSFPALHFHSGTPLEQLCMIHTSKIASFIQYQPFVQPLIHPLSETSYFSSCLCKPPSPKVNFLLIGTAFQKPACSSDVLWLLCLNFWQFMEFFDP